MDAVFHSRVDAPVEPEVSVPKETSVSTTNVDVPYLNYEGEHKHPYIVDHFELGDYWNDPVGGFPEEIGILEGYLTDQINKGEIANSVESVKERIRQMEKVNNLSKHERTVMRIGTLSEYAKFLMAKEDIKFNIRRYGQSK